ncbi:MAG: response regulator [Bdellovibrionales bacterium]|nr:response regulator [Bdellovibrionales bacterium]
MNYLNTPISSNEIIMVDDSEVDSYIIQKCLVRSKLKNKFVYFDSGDKFLNYMHQVESGNSPVPAVVLLDINMPMMDGFEVLEKVRSNKRFCDIPNFIMFSSSNNPKEVSRAHDLKADYQEKFLNYQDTVNFLDSLANNV